MNRSIYRRPVIVAVLAAVMVFSMTLTGVAQDERNPPPPRDQNLPSPDREAVILEQEQTPEGTNTIIEIPAEADTYIASGYPNVNFGNEALFLGYNLAGEDPYEAERMLLRFDVEGNIPDDAVINSGIMELRLSYSYPADDSPMGTALRRLASPWNEFNVTWNTEPTWTPIDKITYVGSALDWYEWDITTEVADWAADVYPNNGVEVIGDEAVQYRERAFYSRETSAVYFPRLVVNYTTSDDDQAPEVSVEPLPAYSPRHFTVSWDGTDPGGSGIDYYDVQVRIDGGAWQDWLMGITDTEAEYGNGENGRDYAFRARGVDNAGNVEAFGAAEASTTVDSQPPSTTVDPLPHIINATSFTVSWSGSDAGGSGIDYYDVQYKFGTGSWILWLPQTLATSVEFTNADDGLYLFEARAVDNLGQTEVFENTAEASIIVDAEPPFITPKVWMPVVLK